MKIDLLQMLSAYAKDDLAHMVTARGILIAPNARKGDLASTLMLSLLRAEDNQQMLRVLSKEDRRVLDRLIMRGGAMRTPKFRRDLTRAGLVTASSASASYRGSPVGRGRQFEDVIARLSAAGLVFTTEHSPAQGSNAVFTVGSPGELMFVPDEVLAHLPSVPFTMPALPDVAVDGVRHSPPSLFQRDLFLYWRFARRNDVILTNRGTVAKRQLAKIVDGLIVSEPVDAVAGEHELRRSYFLRLLLEDLGLAQRVGNGLVADLSALEFFAMPVADRCGRAFHAWRSMVRWNELTRLPGVVIDYLNNSFREPPPDFLPQARAFVCSLLADLPPDRWISFAHFADRAAHVDAEFLLPREYRPAGYYAYYASARERSPYEPAGNPLGWHFVNVKDDEQGWQTVEGGFLRTLVSGPLHWLGLTDLGYEQGHLQAFRLNDLAVRLCRGESLTDEAPVAPNVIVQPNFQILAFDPVGEDVLASIDRFATLVRAEQAVEFQLSRESVYRAQQEGHSVADIVSFLERISGRPLPQNVRRTLDEWESHHERIVVRHGVTLLHAASPALLDRIFADTSLAPHLVRRLTPVAALVDGKVNRLLARLLERGHLPSVCDRGGEEKAAIAVGMDGVVTFPQRLPDLYVWRRLVPFAEQRDGALWLTPGSVRAAVDSGLSAEDIVACLAGLHRGPLPDTIAQKIKVWAKHWGDASLANVTLLAVRDHSVLSELLADPALGPILQPYAPNGAVALVRPQDLGRLRAALTEKGIPLNE